MTNGVLSEAFHLVDRLRGIRMPTKFCIQIPRMIGRLQGPAEIVHGEHVFQELGLLEVANASRLPCGIELMRERIGARVEVVIVSRFVDAHAPENDRWMIPVPPN